MRIFLNIVNYLFGSAFNIIIAIAVIFVGYTVTVRAFEHGQGLLVSDDGTEYSQEVVVVIPEDASTLDIGRILRDHELIGNEFIFVLQAQLNGTSNHFRTGVTFHMDTQMSDAEVMDALTRIPQIPAGDLRITIIEGMTARQIGEYAASRGFFTLAEFLEEFNDGIYQHRFLDEIPERNSRLEGFLFPDTYMLPPNPTPRDLIIRQLNRFQEMFTPDMRERMEERGLTLDEVIIMASIVEREARVAAQRPAAASVIFNRLEAEMPLEMYSTLTFAVNRHRTRLLAADYHSTSPYNTFNRTGLPVGPISNPGLNSIFAVLNAPETDYFYFLIADYATGRLHFEETYEGFLEAQERYLSEGDDD